MNRVQYTRIFTGGAGTVVLGLLLAGCGSAPSAASTTNCSATATTTTQTATLVGTIASINTASNTFTVSNTVTRGFTTAGTITVSYTSAPATPTTPPNGTTFLQQSTSSISALTTNSLVQVDVPENNGTPVTAPTGDYQATVIAIGITGLRGGARNNRTGTPASSAACPHLSPTAGSRPANVLRITGAVSAVTTNTDGTAALTVTQRGFGAGAASANAGSTYVIDTAASTTITQMKSVDASALQVGQPVSIVGTKSGSSGLTARNVSILLALPAATATP